MILILGQAAQGKSTLAASHAASSETPTAWISLGPEDSDAVNLLYLLTLSMQRVLEEIDFSPVLNYPSLALGPREEMSLYREWSQSLFERIPCPIQVILDGLDSLSDQAPSFRLLHVMLEEAPPGVCFIMLSRWMPPFPVQALKMRQQACILESEDLAFTLSETKRFFASVRRLNLTAEQVHNIHQLTGGWIGGMVLLGESMERSPRDLLEDLLARDFSEKLHAEVFRYFGENIFDAEASNVKDFLIHSSILDIIEPGFAGDLTGVDNARQILDDLTGRSLFIQSSFDRKKGWLFKYHQLFRDFLRARLRAALGEERQRAMCLRAASLFEERGEWEEAVKYHLQGKAYPEAAGALVRIGLDLLHMGRTADLSRWINGLPEALVQESPWLLFYLFMTRRFSGASEDILKLQRAFHLFEDQEDERGQLLSLAYLIEAAVFRGHPAMSIGALTARGEALLASLSTDRHPHERAVLWFQMGFGQYMRCEDPRRGLRACEHAFLLARGLGDLVLQINAAFNVYLSLCYLGEFREAEEWREAADELIQRCDYPELRASYQHTLCQAALLQGDLATAEKMLDLFKETVKRHNLLFLHLQIMKCDFLLNYLRGRYARAEEIGRACHDLSRDLGNRWAQGGSLHIMAVSYQHQGQWRKARDFFLQAREILSTPEGYSFPLLQTTKLHLGLIAVQLGEITPDIEREVRESLDHYIDISAPSWMADGNFVMALLRWAQGMKKEAGTHLQAALAIARERRLHHFFATPPRELARACLLALELELPQAEREYAGRLLCAHLADLAEPGLEQLTRHSKKRVAQCARQLRRDLHRSRAPRLRVRTLGELRLWRGETLMEEREWERGQPRLLLKAVLARGPRAVSKDSILEDLWPGATPKTAENNLRVNLHRLRKALEPSLDKDSGSAYVHFQGNRLALDEDLWQIDANEFSVLCRQGRAREEEGDAGAALALYQEAVALYGGDFLAEDLYLPWTASRREELRRTYLDTLLRYAGLLEARGALTRAAECLQKALRADPALEVACQRLMLLYAQKGRRSAALRTYADCRGALREELNTEPDAVTTAIFQRILEGQNRS